MKSRWRGLVLILPLRDFSALDVREDVCLQGLVPRAFRP